MIRYETRVTSGVFMAVRVAVGALFFLVVGGVVSGAFEAERLLAPGLPDEAGDGNYEEDDARDEEDVEEGAPSDWR